MKVRRFIERPLELWNHVPAYWERLPPILRLLTFPFIFVASLPFLAIFIVAVCFHVVTHRPEPPVIHLLPVDELRRVAGDAVQYYARHIQQGSTDPEFASFTERLHTWAKEFEQLLGETPPCKDSLDRLAKECICELGELHKPTFAGHVIWLAKHVEVWVERDGESTEES
jgi:hypothetical protein